MQSIFYTKKEIVRILSLFKIYAILPLIPEFDLLCSLLCKDASLALVNTLLALSNSN